MLAVFLFATIAYPASAETGVLRVMTYNIFWGKYGMEGIAENIRQQAPDVVLLQEVDRKTARSQRLDQFDYLRQALGWEGAFAPAYSYPDDQGVHGLAAFSRLPLRDVEIFPLTQVPGHKNRVLLRVRVDWQGRAISFYTTHLVAWGHGRWTARADRNAQARDIRKILDADPNPVVLTGDFNTSSRSKAFRILSQGLVDAWRAAGRGWWGGTSYSFLPLFRIDHILADPRLRVLQCTVVHSLASDHNAVVADLVWDDPEAKPR